MVRYDIYTPDKIVDYLLSSVGYVRGAEILNKHFMDNSCGNGNILVHAVKRYIDVYIDIHGNYEGLENDIAKYFHGIEIDDIACNECISRVCDAVRPYCEIEPSTLDIRCANTFQIADEYKGKMDFVVGNPPYVRYHALSNENKAFIKTLPLCKIGIPDLYIAFFNIGMDMMSDNGSLSYITPSSWINSRSGALFRNRININGSLRTIIDFEHEQVFEQNGVTTYSMITVLDNGSDYEDFEYFRYDKIRNDIVYVDTLDYSYAFFNGQLYLGTNKTLRKVKKIFDNQESLGITVKNGFATLSDKVFIDNLPNLKPTDHKFVKNIVKASTGDKKYCLFPYDDNLNAVSLDIIQKEDPEVYEYILANKEALEHRDYDNFWYTFGRKQGLTDMKKTRISINNLVRCTGDIKMQILKPYDGVYSGFYINGGNIDMIDKLNSDEFIEFVKSLRHYKSGGYYSFTSKELEKYLNFSF